VSARHLLTRADTGDNSRGVDLHPLPVGELLKLLAWPAAVFGFGFLAMGLHLLQLGGWL